VSRIARQQSQVFHYGRGSDESITKMSAQIWVSSDQIGKGNRDLLVRIYRPESLQKLDESSSLAPTEEWVQKFLPRLPGVVNGSRRTTEKSARLGISMLPENKDISVNQVVGRSRRDGISPPTN